jgi:hypothetical protein
MENEYNNEDEYDNNDLIVEETTGILNAKADSQAVAEAIANTSGNSEGIAIAVASASSLSVVSVKLVGLENQDTIDTGKGMDTVKGIASGEVSVSAVATAAAAAIAIAKDTSSATAISSATAVAEAVGDITVVGIENLGKIATGEGNDIVTGEASASTVTEAFTETITLAFASAENGEATAIANAAALATSQATATTIGIKEGEFYLGGGDDTINATATGGDTNIGVQNVLIFGGEGNDTFNLQNGTGNINGGEGNDLLILEGLYIDYTFDDAGVVYGVKITNDGNNTNLIVSEVENFQFTEDPETNIVYMYYEEKVSKPSGGKSKNPPAMNDHVIDDNVDSFDIAYSDSLDPIVNEIENLQPTEDFCPVLM